MLPYSARSFLGYRLLTEFFAFPAKFLFFDVELPGPEFLGRQGREVEVYLYCRRSLPDLEFAVSADTFQLGCVPAVNLFPQRAEPIPLTHETSEFPVVADARRAKAVEVYSVDRVVAHSPAGEAVEYFPLYGATHAGNRRETFWHAARRPTGPSTAGGPESTVAISVVDLGLRTSVPADWALDVQTTCCNHDLPHRLPAGNLSRLHFVDGGGPVGPVRLVTPPTRALRPPLRHGAAWRLVSHLTLNHLSIAGGAEGADALREILMLYDFADSAETRSMIEGVRAVSSRRVTGRVPGGRGRGAFCEGVEVSVQFDEGHFAGSGLFLFACVLERFLAMYCSVNAFSQLVATTIQRKEKLRTWRPRAGERVLL
jgi:type VI secretion system protein ImpG